MQDIPNRLKLDKRNDGIVISTVKVICLAWYGDYETAISIDNANWRIYEGYNTEEEALEGHKKYMNMTKEEILKLDTIG